MQAYAVQTLMGLIGSVWFAILFGVYDRRLIVIALGGGAGWIVYLSSLACGQSVFIGLLAASMFVAAVSEILARLLKTPVILLLVPMLIPEIPGGDLYYTMYYLVQGSYTEFGNSSNRMLVEAGAIAMGIIAASHLEKFLQSLWNHVVHRAVRS